MNNNSNWKSRKLWVAMGLVVMGMMASFLLPAFSKWFWLKEHTMELFKMTLMFAVAWIFSQAGQNIFSIWKSNAK